jgi:hypothetical protein
MIGKLPILYLTCFNIKITHRRQAHLALGHVSTPIIECARNLAEADRLFVRGYMGGKVVAYLQSNVYS